MNKQRQIVRGKAAVIACLVLIIAFIGAISLSGCKEKVTEPKATGPATGPVGTCEVLDKLPGDLAKPVEVNYGNKIKLMGITVVKLPKNQLSVSYYWQPMDDLGSFNMAFVHFTDKGNKTLTQNDHVFCQGKTSDDVKGKFVKENYTISIPESAAGQEISVKIGFYDPKVGARLKVESARGIPLDEGNTRAIVESLKL